MALKLDRPAIPLPIAIEVAGRFLDKIAGCTERRVVAGSIRRRAPAVRDIEIVAVPRLSQVTMFDLFGQPIGGDVVDHLDARMTDLLERGIVEKRRMADGSTRWGPALKLLSYEGYPVDLFCPSAERLGWILLIRTGPAAFSRQLVVPVLRDDGRPGRTKDGRPGLLPSHLAPRDGWLTYRGSGDRLSTATEREVFALFGLEYRDPWERR